MEKLKQLCPNKDEAELREAATRYGFNADELSESDAEAIASELNAGGAIAPANKNGKSAPSVKDKSRGRRKAKEVSLQDAIVHAAKETETELSTMEGAIRRHKGKYVEARTTAIVNEIRNTSTEIVEGITTSLMEEKADAETFLEIGDAFGKNLFPSFEGTDA